MGGEGGDGAAWGELGVEEATWGLGRGGGRGGTSPGAEGPLRLPEGWCRGTRGSPVAASHALAMPAQTFRASGQSFTSCVTVSSWCSPAPSGGTWRRGPSLPCTSVCLASARGVLWPTGGVALCLGNRRRGRCRARASIAVLCFARGARGARASQCRCACYAYFVLTYGNSVCGRIRHRMSAGGGAHSAHTRFFRLGCR